MTPFLQATIITKEDLVNKQIQKVEIDGFVEYESTFVLTTTNELVIFQAKPYSDYNAEMIVMDNEDVERWIATDVNFRQALSNLGIFDKEGYENHIKQRHKEQKERQEKEAAIEKEKQERLLLTQLKAKYEGKK